MNRFVKCMIAALALASTGAHAAMSPDVTGLWYNPSEPGWGAAIAQQGDIVFVTLFAYDEQKRAQWFVASSVTDAGSGVHSGTLYRTSGPSFGGAFDPRLVEAVAVGTLSLQYADVDGQGLLLGYTVNGVAVNKAVLRQTWQSNVTRLPGAYFGGVSLSLAAVPQPAGCPAPPAFLPPGGPLRITVAEPSTVAIIGSEGIDTRTVIGGVYFQAGQLGLIAGSVFAGPVVNPPVTADAQVTRLVVSDDGFIGHVKMVMNGCLFEGAIGGIRR